MNKKPLNPLKKLVTCKPLCDSKLTCFLKLHLSFNKQTSLTPRRPASQQERMATDPSLNRQATTALVVIYSFSAAINLIKVNFNLYYYTPSHENVRLYFPAKEDVLRTFIAIKNSSPRPGLNPRTIGPMTSTLITTPPRRSVECKLFCIFPKPQ
jgi:hypothetical protein